MHNEQERALVHGNDGVRQALSDNQHQTRF
jgi:hypothetical protein